MGSTVRLLAVGGIAIATAVMPFARAEAETAETATEPTVQGYDQAGPYSSWSNCEVWRDYYATFYDTLPCYHPDANWYFVYCCV
jgi:hypothetical protein